jgi:hypothetical protein
MNSVKHRHRWVVVSTHQVSEGLVVYQRCLCGRWRVATAPLDPDDSVETARTG